MVVVAVGMMTRSATNSASCSSGKPILAEPLLAWTAPMSTTDLRTDVPIGRAENAPWWAVAFAALLLAVSFRQRQAGEETGRAGEKTDRPGNRVGLEAGR